jgi:hypothetical protein
MVDEETYENIDSDKAEELADLLTSGKLEESKNFISYENALVEEPVKKAASSSKPSKK